jgi:hypothetical protein
MRPDKQKETIKIFRILDIISPYYPIVSVLFNFFLNSLIKISGYQGFRAEPVESFGSTNATKKMALPC